MDGLFIRVWMCVVKSFSVVFRKLQSIPLEEGSHFDDRTARGAAASVMRTQSAKQLRELGQN
jgi:hypothetical protein